MLFADLYTTKMQWPALGFPSLRNSEPTCYHTHALPALCNGSLLVERIGGRMLELGYLLVEER